VYYTTHNPTCIETPTFKNWLCKPLCAFPKNERLNMILINSVIICRLQSQQHPHSTKQHQQYRLPSLNLLSKPGNAAEEAS
jgi:hypothetical protein